nr:ribonuclease H-like domain-containing protein [Tanacetum cinerariifolium]
MAKSSSSSDNEVYDDSYCSKSCRKNTKNLNTEISKLNEELSYCETDFYNYKRGLSQVEARLVEFKENEVKQVYTARPKAVINAFRTNRVNDVKASACWVWKPIKPNSASITLKRYDYVDVRGRSRVLERDVEIRDNKIEYLKNELEQVKKEKESLDNKLTGFENASKDLDNLLGSQRSGKNKEGLGYSAVPPPLAQIYLPPKKDLSWTGLPEFVDDIVTDYSRPTPSKDASKCNKSELQSSNFSVFEHGESTDYALWEVIINGDSLVPEPPAVGTVVPLETEAQKLAIKYKLNAKSTLLLDIPDEYLLKFHSIKDAKSLWEAIKIRFGGNKESKKMHKTILKQQYKNFVASRSEGLDKTYDRFQKLISQLELNETLSMDDLYNNLKVYEAEIKGQSSSSSNSHNVAFVSSENTSSINETVNAAHDIPDVGSKEQPSASSYADDVAMIIMRVKKFMKKTGRNLNFNGKESVGFDKKRVELETPASALVVQDRWGGYEWSYQAEEGPIDFALMAYSLDSANSSNYE